MWISNCLFMRFKVKEKVRSRHGEMSFSPHMRKKFLKYTNEMAVLGLLGKLRKENYKTGDGSDKSYVPADIIRAITGGCDDDVIATCLEFYFNCTLPMLCALKHRELINQGYVESEKSEGYHINWAGLDALEKHETAEKKHTDLLKVTLVPAVIVAVITIAIAVTS